MHGLYIHEHMYVYVKMSECVQKRSRCVHTTVSGGYI